MMVTKAPVCHLTNEIQITQPPAAKFPTIPVAQPNLDSLMAALNAMRQALMMLMGQIGKHGPTGRYSEVQRQVQTVRVSNPSDPSQYVDVQMITGLAFQDTVTGEQWAWRR